MVRRFITRRRRRGRARTAGATGALAGSHGHVRSSCLPTRTICWAGRVLL